MRKQNHQTYQILNNRLQQLLATKVQASRGRELLLLGANELAGLGSGRFLHSACVLDNMPQIPQFKGAVASYDALPFASDQIDVVVAWHVVADAANMDAVMAELARIVASNGKVIMVNLNPWQGLAASGLGAKARPGQLHSLSQIRIAGVAHGLSLANVKRLGMLPSATKSWHIALDRTLSRLLGPIGSAAYIAEFTYDEPGLTPLPSSQFSTAEQPAQMRSPSACSSFPQRRQSSKAQKHALSASYYQGKSDD